ncbi:MAG: hypothetical protein IJZ15_02110 [Oscillospiraceae bacterium]|nr:hypothetical protein [Oscillospiraceae bacterium]
MKKFKRVICGLLVMITLLAVSVPAYAAKTSNVSTAGSMRTATVITVKTDKKTTLEFKQTKGKAAYLNKALGTSYINTYGDFYLYVVDQSGKEAPKKYECSFKKSITIKLSANKTYKISILPQTDSVTYNRLVKSGKLWYRNYLCSGVEWTKIPEWSITAKKVVSLKVNSVVKAPR